MDVLANVMIRSNRDTKGVVCIKGRLAKPAFTFTVAVKQESILR